MNDKPRESQDQPPKLCPKCRGTMYVGFLSDHSGGDVAKLIRWHFGTPDSSLEAGLDQVDESLELYGGGISVNAFRCEACGYVELFAP